MTVVRRLSSGELTTREVAALRALFDASWPDPEDAFSDEDFDHAFGGMHFVVEADERIVSHASVVERELHTGGHRLATGYVEGVATLPDHRRRGWGSAIMAEVGAHIDGTFRLGALGTGLHAFYERIRMGHVEGADVGPHGPRSRADARGGRLRPGPPDAHVPCPRPLGADQLRLATRRRLVALGSASPGSDQW